MTLNEAIAALQAAGIESPEFDARELFMHFGGFKRYELVSRQLSLEDSLIKPRIEERCAGRPLQYIIGEVGIYRESYKVTPDCLIPRQDTELLVDYAVKNIPAGEEFIDLCTGSGCVAISTLRNTEKTLCTAIDISEAALNVAKENARLNDVSDRVTFKRADVLGFIPERPVFAILSNPPYVTEKEYEGLARELYHEPKIAFVGGKDGLDFYKKIVELTKSYINPCGFIAFEIGKDQAEALKKIAEENAMTAEIYNDTASLARLAVLKHLK